MDFKAKGLFLKREREKKGLSFDQIFEKTRIQPEILQGIEEGTSSLAPALLKSFIKAYGEALHLDISQLLEDNQAESLAQKKPSSHQKKKRIPLFQVAFLKRKILSYGIPILIIAVLFFWITTPQDRENQKQIVLEDELDLSQRTFSEHVAHAFFEEEIVIQASNSLELYFKTDNQALQTRQLASLEWYTIKATDKIYLRFNNQKSVNIFYNGQKIDYQDSFFEKTFSRDTL